MIFIGSFYNIFAGKMSKLQLENIPEGGIVMFICHHKTSKITDAIKNLKSLDQL